jgi:hypothetical protein
MDKEKYNDYTTKIITSIKIITHYNIINTRNYPSYHNRIRFIHKEIQWNNTSQNISIAMESDRAVITQSRYMYFKGD